MTTTRRSSTFLVGGLLMVVAGAGCSPAGDSSRNQFLGASDGSPSSTDGSVQTLPDAASEDIDVHSVPSEDASHAIDDSATADDGGGDAGQSPVDSGVAGDGGQTQGDGQAGGCPGLFCEDFEKGSIDPAVWSTPFNGKQAAGVVQTAKAAHGKYAVQFHAVNSDRAYSFIITKNAPPGLRGHHFGRAYFYVTPMPPAMHTEFLFSGTSGFPMLKYLEVAGIGNAWQLTFVDLATGGAESYRSGGSIPLARWTCLEWEFTDTPDQASVFVDGTLSYTTPNGFTSGGKSTGLVGAFTSFGFGFYAWHPATYDFDLYYDDIVLDVKRIGCLP